MKRVLITGITGFVGSHLADLALAKGVEVWGFKRYRFGKVGLQQEKSCQRKNEGKCD